MRSVVRSKVEMAEGVRAFHATHPDPDPGAAPALAAFEARLRRLQELAVAEQSGRSRARTANRLKWALRQELREELLRHLGNVAELAMTENPELGRLRLAPRGTRAHLAFLATAKSILGEAEKVVAVLAKHGLSESIFRRMTTTLADLEVATVSAQRASQEHTGARRELNESIGELMKRVAVLDGLNRFRFKDNPQALGEWERAVNVLGPFRGRAKKDEPTGGEPRLPRAA